MYFGMLAFILLSVVIGVVESKPQYIPLNPNGAKVPGVVAIGHKDPNGGGPENSYGTDFKKNLHKWTVALCNSDSDGDGASNGLELGDPCCVWVQGGPAPAVTTDLSNPGDSSSTTKRAMPECTSSSPSASNTPGASSSTLPSASASYTPEPAYTTDRVDNTFAFVGLAAAGSVFVGGGFYFLRHRFLTGSQPLAEAQYSLQ